MEFILSNMSQHLNAFEFELNLYGLKNNMANMNKNNKIKKNYNYNVLLINMNTR